MGAKKTRYPFDSLMRARSTSNAVTFSILISSSRTPMRPSFSSDALICCGSRFNLYAICATRASRSSGETVICSRFAISS